MALAFVVLIWTASAGTANAHPPPAGAWLPASASNVAGGEYAVTASPTGSRTVLISGFKAVVRWTGPGVPDGDVQVDVYLRKGAGPEIFLGSGPNRGKLKVSIPSETISGSDYTFVVRLQSDPGVAGATAPVIISNEGEQYIFSEPDEGEYWARGFTRTILWATPPTAPPSTVMLELFRTNGTFVASWSGEPNDGSFDYAIPSNLAAGDFFFVITNETDAAYFGHSDDFSISRIEPLTPAEGATWAVGSSQTVTWNTGAANNGGVVRLSLRGVSNGYSRALAIGVPYPDGTRTVTVPSTGNVPPAGEYFVQLLYTYTPPGGVETRYVSNSNRFTVVTAGPPPPPPPPPPPRHFPAPLATDDARITWLAVTGFIEGSEVGVFAAMGDGSPVLVASGVVEDGEAFFMVPSDIVDGADELAFGPTASLSLRAFVGGIERVFEPQRVSLGSDGSHMDAVRYAPGDIVVVTVDKGTGAPADPLVLRVAPNPTAGEARVRLSLPDVAHARVVLHDVLGRTVATLHEGPMPAGEQELRVPARLTAGVYIVRLDAGPLSQSVRLTVTR